MSWNGRINFEGSTMLNSCRVRLRHEVAIWKGEKKEVFKPPMRYAVWVAFCLGLMEDVQERNKNPDESEENLEF